MGPQDTRAATYTIWGLCSGRILCLALASKYWQKQQYDRIGPPDTQKVWTFDNGTCLTYGPDVSSNQETWLLCLTKPGYCWRIWPCSTSILQPDCAYRYNDQRDQGSTRSIRRHRTSPSRHWSTRSFEWSEEIRGSVRRLSYSSSRSTNFTTSNTCLWYLYPSSI